MKPLPMADATPQDAPAPCCGPAPGPPSSPHERPGYAIRSFVESFADTPAGPVPRIRTALGLADRLGAIGARIGCTRDTYRVAPGLYCLGNATSASPVLVTANYKLTFDAVRSALPGTTAWLLVLDTRGVNVWCAAGKGTFGTDELVRRIAQTRLASIVSHRELIVPQLGATGVAAHKVMKQSGFSVVWAPVRATDLPRFLASNNYAPPAMRTVTFTLRERLVLAPVELYLMRKTALRMVLAALLLSGIGPTFFSLDTALRRGILLAAACLGGTLAGTLAVPALLPWLPGRMFACKGAVLGLCAGLAISLFRWSATTGPETLALPLAAAATASYCGMHFTGSAPFTSPTGVEKEMRRWMPIQTLAALAATVMWLWAPFV